MTLQQLPALLPWAVAARLLGVGLYAIVTSRNFIHLIGCLSVVQSATYVLLLSVGFRTGGTAPIFYTSPPGTPAVDPVVHALVLTDVVIGATVTALLLALILQLHKRRGTVNLPPRTAGDPALLARPDHGLGSQTLGRPCAIQPGLG